MFEEQASGAAYEGRTDIRNTQPGDGVRFKGRGPIQLTGRGAYTDYGNLLGLHLTANPELVALPSVAFQTTAKFWEKRRLNLYCANGTQEEFYSLTVRINGRGARGLLKRWARNVESRRILGCPVPQRDVVWRNTSGTSAPV